VLAALIARASQHPNEDPDVCQLLGMNCNADATPPSAFAALPNAVALPLMLDGWGIARLRRERGDHDLALRH
jgi:hypothetical protein